MKSAPRFIFPTPYPLLYYVLLILSLHFISCKKDVINTDNSLKLKFSTESVLFDTVFTTIGSVTKQIKIYNTNSQKINISAISLVGGSNSMFSLNINGSYKPSASNIEIAANDSLFIFVKVTVDPRNSNNPLVVKDSILFNTNNNVQYVNLVAWGQDAHFIVADTHINGLPSYKIVAKAGDPPVEWKLDKPYVIYGYAVVDSTGVLVINEGVKVYFYKNSGLWIYRYGSLIVKGTKANPVTFQGTRLDTSYRKYPGQWDRIWINEGSYNNINYAVIKNAFIGIQAETIGSYSNIPSTQLVLSNSRIENCSGIGMLARNFNIDAFNCIVANCGQYGIALTLGGKYDFRNCTLGNYWDYNVRQTPSLVLNNYLADANGNNIKDFNLEKAYFGNCIIWGNTDEEILLSKGNNNFNYYFDHCILKTKLNVSDTKYYQNILLNKDPLFKNSKYPQYYTDKRIDYHIYQESPAKNAGSISILNSYLLQRDLDGDTRVGNTTDIGAYIYK